MNEKKQALELSEQDLNELIKKAKEFFRTQIAPSHIANTKKLTRLKEFNLNPFLNKYKASFLTGNVEPLSIARALVYPRILGTSIDTSFGSKLQKFCSEVLEGFASTTSGIDIEFIDKIDGNRKYCQIKAGPNTINKDDVETIKGHFTAVRNLARTNGKRISVDDMVLGVFYGTPEELSAHYKKVDEDFPVFVGEEFWHRLTGDKNFYDRITDAIGEVASEFDSSELIEDVIQTLAKEIEKLDGFDSNNPPVVQVW
ncbi:PmeII family type II restriction endonuclease [Priestia megaterium]|uniref:PmeII family type II restriction endonuclease n=1 Tax=Priestia megaterium TaxID=1404 RepID=UPI00203E5131|nr:PmeII family type II restriction endonuclease [Priestia megaterium]MCM3195820.1 restriction endonuclease [Priestia megaterium]